MSKAFDLWGGTPPDPAYVDDPAGGRARRFQHGSPHAIFAAHEDFGNAVRFPGGSAGNALFVFRFRAALNVHVGANINGRSVIMWRPVVWSSTSWDLLPPAEGLIRATFNSNNRLDWEVQNDKGGQNFGIRRWRWSTADTESICDGTWREYRYEAPLINGQGMLRPKTFADGVEVPSIQDHWLHAALDLSHETETRVGGIFVGSSNNNAEFDISALALEIKEPE